ncbi:hypothetical protein AAVH_28070 [Aphelenchoides avenae]|nr:hypothetical protein AAVH_28070 [Aphelenchus avenae]
MALQRLHKVRVGDEVDHHRHVEGDDGVHDFPPPEFPNYMHHSKLLEYLRLYVEEHHLPQYGLPSQSGDTYRARCGLDR